MANLATVLKDEIRRLARKEVNAQTEVLRRNSAAHRRDIANLKRQVTTLEKKVALLEKKTWREATSSSAKKEDLQSARFSAKGLASQRKRLKISGADYAKLAGVSTPTLYNWESGKSRPRKEQLARLIALRGISKREAIARLKVL